MTDYYMSAVMEGPLCCKSSIQWDCKLRTLRIGQSFTVATAALRHMILTRASRIGVMVSTVKLPDGTYSIKRIKDAPPRKPGQPAKWGLLGELA